MKAVSLKKICCFFAAAANQRPRLHETLAIAYNLGTGLLGVLMDVEHPAFPWYHSCREKTGVSAVKGENDKNGYCIFFRDREFKIYRRKIC